MSPADKSVGPSAADDRLLSEGFKRCTAGYACPMPEVLPLPPEVVTRKQAAAILGVSRKRVTNMRSTGELTPADVPGHRGVGLFWRHEVEAEAARRAERRAAIEAKAVRPSTPLPELPPDQEATFEELMAAAR